MAYARVSSPDQKEDLDRPGRPGGEVGDAAGMPVFLALGYRMLAELSANAGRGLTHEYLLERLWGVIGAAACAHAGHRRQAAAQAGRRR